ncbi:MAG: KOW domain-containing RNA-binding protein [Cellulosilyticaceae bacterium]
MRADYALGQIVFSKCGRDKGRPFIVTSIETEYVHLVDGSLRPVEKPKLKKKKHIQKTNTIVDCIRTKIVEDGKVTDFDVRSAIDDYLNKTSIEEGGL